MKTLTKCWISEHTCNGIIIINIRVLATNGKQRKWTVNTDTTKYWIWMQCTNFQKLNRMQKLEVRSSTVVTLSLSLAFSLALSRSIPLFYSIVVLLNITSDALQWINERRCCTEAAASAQYILHNVHNVKWTNGA